MSSCSNVARKRLKLTPQGALLLPTVSKAFEDIAAPRLR